MSSLMKIFQGYQPREGDVVLVPATVQIDYLPLDDNYVHLNIGAVRVGLPLEDIVGVRQLRLRPGDRVRQYLMERGHPKSYGLVLAVDGRMVWMKTDLGAYTSVAIADLERLPPRDPPAAPSSTEENPS